MASTLPKQLREHLRALGRKGGQTRAKRLTKAERSASAKLAATARWAKKKGT